MRRTGLLAAVLLVVTLTGCGSDDEDGDTASGADAPAATAPSSATGSGVAGGQLTAAVGEEGNPDAFVLTVQDAAGADVTTLPAGTYEIAVSDRSTIHNVHLTGSGVDETTTVPGTGDATWSVTLQPGTYTVVCDPHAKMRVEIDVT